MNFDLQDLPARCPICASSLGPPKEHFYSNSERSCLMLNEDYDYDTEYLSYSHYYVCIRMNEMVEVFSYDDYEHAALCFSIERMSYRNPDRSDAFLIQKFPSKRSVEINDSSIDGVVKKYHSFQKLVTLMS